MHTWETLLWISVISTLSFHIAKPSNTNEIDYVGWTGPCTFHDNEIWLPASFQRREITKNAKISWRFSSCVEYWNEKYRYVAEYQIHVINLPHIGGLVSPIFIKITNRDLTHWGRDKIDAISQTTFSSAFSWMKMNEFRLGFHWSLFLRFESTIFHHWFR